MNKIILAIALGGLVSLTACKKDAGSGGTSSVAGNVSGRVYSGNSGSSAEKEVTQITIPDGSDIADGEYLLLNTPNNGLYYYVWFKWTSGVQPDPFLAGRIGIQVDFDFTQNNLTVATNTAAAIQAAVGTDFTVTINNDIITLTNNLAGEVPDADELTSNILVDIENQGESAVGGSSSYVEGPIVDERVYLIYGDEDYYSESVRTDANGDYQFKGLNRGTYRVYAFSGDTLNPGGMLQQVEVSSEIANKKEVVQAPALFVVKF
jgi:hypothetical protein